MVMYMHSNAAQVDLTAQPGRRLSFEWQAESPTTDDIPENARLTPEQNVAYEQQRSIEHAQLLGQRLDRENDLILHELMVDTTRAFDILDGQEPSLPPFTRLRTYGTFQRLVDFYPPELGMRHRPTAWSSASTMYSPTVFTPRKRRRSRETRSSRHSLLRSSKHVAFAGATVNHTQKRRMRSPPPPPPPSSVEQTPTEPLGHSQAHREATGGLVHAVVIGCKQSHLGSWVFQSGKTVDRANDDKARHDATNGLLHAALVRCKRSRLGSWIRRSGNATKKS